MMDLFDHAESARRKREGIERVSRGHGDWLHRVRARAVGICLSEGTVTSDDLQAAFALPPGASPNLWGAVFRDPRFERAGFERSGRVPAHSRVISRWRLREG